jgi:hypothetical protein
MPEKVPGVESRATRRRPIAVSGLVIMMVLSVLGGPIASADVAPGDLYTVQISISTESSLPTYFDVSAYNSTGALVTTSQSQYPAGSLRLPSGTYTFTATATQQANYYLASAASSGAVANVGGASVPALCCIHSSPLTEYGFLVQKVDGPLTVTIPTKNINDTSTTVLTIHATLPNGTAARGASVSASVLGNWYWGYSPKMLSMSNTTDSTGRATLATPSAPVLLSAWAFLPVNLPTGQTTNQETIAGETINVTDYKQPTSVSFGGWSLLTPPQTSASVVLHYQEQEYYLTPHAYYGAAELHNSTGQENLVYPNFGPGGIVPPSSSPQTLAPPTVYVTTGTGATTTIVSSPSGTDSGLVLYAVVGLVGILAVAVAVLALSLRRKKS